MNMTAGDKLQKKSFRAVRSGKPFTVESNGIDMEPVKQRKNQPIVLLDVDGVINILEHTSCLASWTDTKTTFVNDF